MEKLPPYTVRRSRRAKRMRLEVSAERGVEVIVPEGLDRGIIGRWVSSKRSWIERALERIEDRRRCSGSELVEPAELLPSQVRLQAIDEVWRVEYRNGAGNRVGALEQISGGLLVTGKSCRGPEGAAALCRWLGRKARKHLVPWLGAVSREQKLPFRRVTIRGQRTRWASCSARGTISLNRNLLFIGEDLVRYVFIHELCHTRHLNHSAAFWAEVARREPRCRELDARLRAAWDLTPLWARSPGRR